jgi:hypothetical protein
MFKKFVGISIFVISLLLSPFTIWFMFSTPFLSFDDCYSFATCTGRFVGYYGTTFSPILICIASGYYLFRK